MTQSKNNISAVLILGVLIIGLCILSCNQHRQQKTSQAITPDSSFNVGKEMPIWTKFIPDSELIKGTEVYNDGMISNVSKPTITVYSPKGKNTGTAILVFPGGGYNKLAINLEGSEV